MQLAKAWTAIDRLSNIWKSDLSDKIKRNFFQAVVVLVLLYGCTTWIVTKHIEKKINRNCTRMLWAILIKSWKQHPTKHLLYSHLPPISKTIQLRQTRHTGDCWRSKGELISDVLLWTPSYRRVSIGWPTRTYLQQLSMDIGCSVNDLPEEKDDREGWWDRIIEICAAKHWWWWWWYFMNKFYLIIFISYCWFTWYHN